MSGWCCQRCTIAGAFLSKGRGCCTSLEGVGGGRVGVAVGVAVLSSMPPCAKCKACWSVLSGVLLHLRLSVLPCNGLRRVALCCAVLCCAVLCCAVLCCAASACYSTNLPPGSYQQQMAAGAKVAARFAGMLPGLGITPDSIPTIEARFRWQLDIMQASLFCTVPLDP
jgi:hypothetical protein